jgi:hypothetical protein
MQHYLAVRCEAARPVPSTYAVAAEGGQGFNPHQERTTVHQRPDCIAEVYLPDSDYSPFCWSNLCCITTTSCP